MDFSDYYNIHLRQQNKSTNEEQNNQAGMKYFDNDQDCYSQTTVNNFNTRPIHINNNNFNSTNNFALQDESTQKTGIINGLNNAKGLSSQANNNLKNYQKKFEGNNQRFFGRELSNIEQERFTTSNNMQNNTKVNLTQNYGKPIGYTQINSRNGTQNSQTEGHISSQNNSQQCRMSVEYQNSQNENQYQKINDNNFYSHNNQAMYDENQQKINLNNNTYKANTCKASFDKENYGSVKNTDNNNFRMIKSVSSNQTSKSQKGMMDEEQQVSQQQNDRKQYIDYTFPKDREQKDPVYQHARDIFDYLRQTENYFCAKGTMSNTQPEINVKMRAIMVDWLVDVHLKFKLVPETLYLTINLIDRYIEKAPISKDKLQLLGATSMFIACKIEEIYPPEINDFVFICDSLYTKEDILLMEGEIIITMKFDLTYTSPLRFLDRYCYLNESSGIQQFCAQYLIELALIEYSMVEYSPSNQAASALYLINKIYELDQPWTEELQIQSQYDQNQLKKCARDLYQLLQKANEFQYKYQKSQAEAENQEQMLKFQLEKWYNNEKSKLQSQTFNQDLAEQLELDFDLKRKQIEAKISELKRSLLCNNKNLVAIIRKFSLPKFNEVAKTLFQKQHI